MSSLVWVQKQSDGNFLIVSNPLTHDLTDVHEMRAEAPPGDLLAYYPDSLSPDSSMRGCTVKGAEVVAYDWELRDALLESDSALSLRSRVQMNNPGTAGWVLPMGSIITIGNDKLITTSDTDITYYPRGANLRRLSTRINAQLLHPPSQAYAKSTDVEIESNVTVLTIKAALVDFTPEQELKQTINETFNDLIDETAHVLLQSFSNPIVANTNNRQFYQRIVIQRICMMSGWIGDVWGKLDAQRQTELVAWFENFDKGGEDYTTSPGHLNYVCAWAAEIIRVDSVKNKTNKQQDWKVMSAANQMAIEDLDFAGSLGRNAGSGGAITVTTNDVNGTSYSYIENVKPKLTRPF